MDNVDDLRSRLLDGYVEREEFARALNVTERTVRRWTEHGLPYARRGNLIMIPIERAKEWLRAGKTRELAPIPDAARRGASRAGYDPRRFDGRRGPGRPRKAAPANAPATG